MKVTAKIAEEIDVEQWDVFEKLDSLLEVIASQGEERLSWQANSC